MGPESLCEALQNSAEQRRSRQVARASHGGARASASPSPRKRSTARKERGVSASGRASRDPQEKDVTDVMAELEGVLDDDE